MSEMNSHLSPLGGHGIVSKVLVAAGVKVDAPGREASVLKPASLPDDASKRRGAFSLLSFSLNLSFPLLSKPALQPSSLVPLPST